MEAEMKKFFIFLVCLSLFVLTSCGGGNGDSGKNDENLPSEEETGKESCIISERYGVNFSRKSSRDMCISSMVEALHPGCSWQESEESIAKHLNILSKLEVRFLEEAGSVAGTSRKMCYYPVEDDWFKCPAFLPDSLTFNWFAGCEVYSIVPESDCTAPCADVYYWTDNFWFPVIYAGADKDGGDFVKSFMYDGTASFTAELKLGRGEATVLWTDSGDGIETERKAIAPIEMGEEEVPDLDCFWLGKDLRCY